MYKYVHGETYTASKIAQPIAGIGFVDIVGDDGVTPIAYTAIKLFDDAIGTTELVIDVDFEVGSADARYTALEASTVYRQVRILNATYQSAVFYADFSAVGGYVQHTTYPIGSFYTQYPDADSSVLATAFPDAYRPADLFGGTWVAQWDDEGIDFHTERTNDTGLQTRTDGLQADQLQGFVIQLGTTSDGAFNYGRFTSMSTASALTSGPPVTDGTNGTPRTGTVTCDSNRLVRIWKRTA
jgi:hypothetical protein